MLITLHSLLSSSLNIALSLSYSADHLLDVLHLQIDQLLDDRDAAQLLIHVGRIDGIEHATRHVVEELNNDAKEKTGWRDKDESGGQ